MIYVLKQVKLGLEGYAQDLEFDETIVQDSENAKYLDRIKTVSKGSQMFFYRLRNLRIYYDPNKYFWGQRESASEAPSGCLLLRLFLCISVIGRLTVSEKAGAGSALH